jgi:hypothetical protein
MSKNTDLAITEAAREAGQKLAAWQAVEAAAQKQPVDARNRFKACGMAGVKPRFEKLNGTDVRAFVAARGLRRNISKGQQAIAMAMLYPEPDKRGRGNKGKSTETGDFSQQRLREARAVVRHSVEFAAAVRDGLAKLARAGGRPAS